MSSPTYKLYYFNARGRGETSRFLFALAGVDYEDVRLEGEEWQKKKPGMPFFQMPVLEVCKDGKVGQIAQSRAIARYLAREFGFYGKTNCDAAVIDSIVEQLADVFHAIPFFEKDEQLKKEKITKALDGIIKTSIIALEKMVTGKGDKSFVGDKISFADIEFALNMDMICKGVGKDRDVLLADAPKLQTVYQSVMSNPKIVAWCEKRPYSDF